MTNSQQLQADVLQDRYGLRVAARLSAGTDELSHDISERLRVARMQAVSKRRIRQTVLATSVRVSGGEAALGSGDEDLTSWHRVASALLLVALACGLVAINVIQNEKAANEVAAVDAALLVDDLPPAAYADPGFAQFLKSGDKAP